MKKKNDYADKKLKEIEEMVKSSSCGILITDTGINTYCNGVDMLMFITLLINNANKYLPKELIEKAVELGFKNEKELEKETGKAKKRTEDLIGKLKELVDKM